MSGDGGWVECCLKCNKSHHTYILHTIILTPEGDVAMQFYIYIHTYEAAGCMGLSEDH